ncbi:hypothetical protein AGRA3207_004198 [Actinomadura graeca]|uniref:Secreted protein n=1 Tax=Actinomadura graeca TaxID=2750812 RepID=A0ABX8QWI4_9ACTN|nr:hypothetical protein [Actinomadura graeca]QXJ23083.1 hypothetical protein AGRA3207_004198 [Actinomadura graeca]
MTSDHPSIRRRRLGRALTALTLACGCTAASTALTGVASAASVSLAGDAAAAPAGDLHDTSAMRSGTVAVRAAGTLRAPSCRSITFTGNAGRISVQTSPGGSVAWGIYMHDPSENAGPWVVDVYVGNRRVDHKTQNYPPHGSVAPRDAKSGRIFTIKATHTDLKGRVSHEVPNGCVIP